MNLTALSQAALMSAYGKVLVAKPCTQTKLLVSLTLVFALGIVARSWWLLQESAWIEELHSLRFLGAGNFSSFLERMTAENGTPPSPVYFIIEYWFARWFGPSATGLRVLSLFLGCAFLPATYVLARRVYDQRTGIVAAFLAATSLFLVFYSQEIRMYAPLPLLAALSLLTLIRYLERPQLRNGLCHFAFNALLAWTHMFSWLLIISEGAYLVLARRRDRRLIRAWCAAHAVIGAGFLAWAQSQNTARIVEVTRGYTGLRLADLAVFGLTLGGGRFSNESPAGHLPLGVSLDWLLALILFVLATGFCLGTLRTLVAARGIGKDDHTLLLCLCLFLPPVLLVASTPWFRAAFQYRYLIYCAAPLQILAAAAITHIPRRLARNIILGCVVFLCLYQLSALATGPLRADWRTAGAYLAERRAADDLIVVGERHNALSLACNSTIPFAQMQPIDVWPALCGPVADACKQGRKAWIVLLMHSSPTSVESCLSANHLEFRFQDFAGWPRVRVYEVRSEEVHQTP